MKVVLNALLGIAVRYLAVALSGFLVAHRIATADQGETLRSLLLSPEMLVAIATSLGSVAIACRSWIITHKLLLLAIVTHGRYTLDDLKELSKSESPKLTTPSDVVPVAVPVKPPQPNEPKE